MYKLLIAILLISVAFFQNPIISLVLGFLLGIVLKDNIKEFISKIGSIPLQAGIVLLGFSISFNKFLDLFVNYFPIISIFVLMTFLLGVFLGKLLNLVSIKNLHDQKEWFTKRDEIKKNIGEWIQKETTEHWLNILEPADIWCAKVLDWETMVKHEGFKILDMVQRIQRDDGLDIETLRCPIKIDGEIFKSNKAAPKIGNDNNSIKKEFGI